MARLVSQTLFRSSLSKGHAPFEVGTAEFQVRELICIREGYNSTPSKLLLQASDPKLEVHTRPPYPGPTQWTESQIKPRQDPTPSPYLL